MKFIITQCRLSLERSFCDGSGEVMTAGEWSPRCRHNFSPVPIIRKFPAALTAPAALRNKSDKLHRNRTSTASRWRPPASPDASRREPLAGKTISSGGVRWIKALRAISIAW
jgi:hypothetical protein